MLSKDMDIFRVRPDTSIKVGSVRFNEKDLSSELNFMAALKNSVKGLGDGAYSVHPADGLFARFSLASHSVMLERRSENTGAMMPCWKNFDV